MLCYNLLMVGDEETIDPETGEEIEILKYSVRN